MVMELCQAGSIVDLYKGFSSNCLGSIPLVTINPFLLLFWYGKILKA